MTKKGLTMGWCINTYTTMVLHAEHYLTKNKYLAQRLNNTSDGATKDKPYTDN